MMGMTRDSVPWELVGLGKDVQKALTCTKPNTTLARRCVYSKTIHLDFLIQKIIIGWDCHGNLPAGALPSFRNKNCRFNELRKNEHPLKSLWSSPTFALAQELSQGNKTRTYDFSVHCQVRGVPHLLCTWLDGCVHHGRYCFPNKKVALAHLRLCLVLCAPSDDILEKVAKLVLDERRSKRTKGAKIKANRPLMEFAKTMAAEPKGKKTDRRKEWLLSPVKDWILLNVDEVGIYSDPNVNHHGRHMLVHKNPSGVYLIFAGKDKKEETFALRLGKERVFGSVSK